MIILTIDHWQTLNIAFCGTDCALSAIFIMDTHLAGNPQEFWEHNCTTQLKILLEVSTNDSQSENEARD